MKEDVAGIEHSVAYVQQLVAAEEASGIGAPSVAALRSNLLLWR